MKSDKYKVFVYGTLKGMTGSKFLGEAVTADDFSMFDGGFPVVRPPMSGDNKRGHILGELHEVDATKLKALDDYEGHPHFFRREVITVRDSSGETTEAWMYIGPPPGSRQQITPSNDGTLSWDRSSMRERLNAY